MGSHTTISASDPTMIAPWEQGEDPGNFSQHTTLRDYLLRIHIEDSGSIGAGYSHIAAGIHLTRILCVHVCMCVCVCVCEM